MRIIDKVKESISDWRENKEAGKAQGLPAPQDLRVSAVRAVADAATARREARELPFDEALFNRYSRLHHHIIAEIAEAASYSASIGKVGVNLHFACNDFNMPPSITSLCSDKEDIYVTIGSQIAPDSINGREIKFKPFQSQEDMYHYFYMLIDWLRETLSESGYEVVAKLLIAYDDDGWSEDKTRWKVTAQWGDEKFKKELGFVETREQAAAYTKGIPLENLKLAGAYSDKGDKTA